MSRLHSLSIAALAAVLLCGCAAPLKPDGADQARNGLLLLKDDPVLAPQVPAALFDAELAVQAAEVPTRDLAGGQHAVHVAYRKIDIARADAERRVAEAELQQLRQQREAILQEAQSRELEIARGQAEAATAAALAQQQATQAALLEAANARAMNNNLRRQMDELQAKATDRGMVMTLGDVLFAVGKSDLQPGAAERLDKLAAFMHAYVDRTLLIEGHTDSQGTDENNLLLSQRRAEAVKVYLIIQSVDSERMTTVGRGKQSPVADNTTPEGRQQNRRVEIVISNTP
ncbi:MAG: OmpA family protein [Stagnimonas sp.]|nr:OmpA family protein [Stagnimonas sp.]